MRLFGSDRVAAMVDRLGLPDDEAIDAKILSGSIESAQKRLESDNFGRRRNVLNYDDVMNQQRNLIYKQRREVLDGKDLKDQIGNWIGQSIDAAAGEYLAGDSSEWDLEGLKQRFYGLIFKDEDLNFTQEELAEQSSADITEQMHRRAQALYAEKETVFPPEQMREIERVILLRNVDAKWMDHLDAMDDLRGSVGLNAYANRSPLVEYRLVGGDMFDEMIANIREDTVRAVLSVTPKQEVKREVVAKVTSEGMQGATTGGKVPTKSAPVKKAPKVGRNDLCPCGSGKKYKKCCGMQENEADD
jgi:preprotein translocase subunit SecA